MRKVLLIAMLAACGNTAAGNELVGQVKKVVVHTPIICPNYVTADLSLGIMQNGVGSLSKEDVVLEVTDPNDIAVLRKAAETGHLVKVTYNIRRVTICVPEHLVTDVSEVALQVPGVQPK